MKKLILILLAIPQMLWATGKVELHQGKTEFLAVGSPGFLKIRGKGSSPKGTLTVEKGILSGEVTVDLKSLDTGMSLRNKHMKEKYLQVEKFPTATLTIKKYKLKPGWSLQQPSLQKVEIPAEVDIHGVVKPVTVQAMISKEGQVTSNFEVQITDFGIDIPSFMGVTVADKVKVEIESQLIAKKADGK